MLYDRIKKEHTRLQEQILELQGQIDRLPEGKLICTHGKDGFRWYHSDGHHRNYIPKKERGMAEKLAVKKYYSLLLEERKQEKRSLECYLRHHSILPQKSEQLFDDPAYRQLLQPWIGPASEEDRRWMETPYERGQKYPEKLVHKTVSGDMVRSKSEAMIAHFLYTHHIPFRYECALHLGEITLYPDFTIRHPVTGEIYYWEHFGRMDDPGYARNVSSKLQLYFSHQIIPTIRLITTYETLDSPLSVETIEENIQNYFM